MDIFNRSKPPIYRGSCPTPPKARTGVLSGLWGGLIGDGTPRYRTRDGENGSAASTVCGGGVMATANAPIYKTAPADVLDEGSGNTESECGCPDGGVNEVYVD